MPENPPALAVGSVKLRGTLMIVPRNYGSGFQILIIGIERLLPELLLAKKTPSISHRKGATKKLKTMYSSYYNLRFADWGICNYKDAGDIQSREQFQVIQKNMEKY